jgi:hypothetical protein
VTSPMLPERWVSPPAPRRPGRLERWCRWWGRRRHPAEGLTAWLLNAYVLSVLVRYAWPSPVTMAARDVVVVVALWAVLVNVMAWLMLWCIDLARAGAKLLGWPGTPDSSGTCSTGPGSRTRGRGRVSAARAALRDARRARSG